MAELKSCSKCGKEKPATTEFFFTTKKIYLRSQCKDCTNKIRNERRRERRSTCPQRTLSETKGCTRCKTVKPRSEFYRRKSGKWDVMCKDCRKAVNSQYQRHNLHKVRQRYSANLERYRAYARKQYYAHHQRNIDAALAKRLTRRARLSGTTGTITKEDVHARYKAQNGLCFYCGCELWRTPFGKGVVDHWIPLSKGGSNEPTNFVMACAACNGSKHAKMPWEFMPDRFTVENQIPPKV